MSSPPSAYDSDHGEETHFWEYVHIVLRRRALVAAVIVATTTVAAVRTFLTRPVFGATAQVLIERENPNVLSFKEVTEVDGARDDYYQTQYKLLQSRLLARRVVESLNLLQNPEFGGPRPAAEVAAALKANPGESALLEGAIDAFLARIAVTPAKNTRLVAVSFEAYQPELAVQGANRLAQLYIQQNLEFRYQISAEAGQWLGTQIEEQRKKVVQADAALQRLKEKEGIVNIEERRTLLEQKLKELGTALTSLKTARLEKEALYFQMKRSPNPEELPEVMRSGLVQSLRIELASLERQQAQLLERYLEQHPEVVKVRNQIQETRKKIAAESQRVIRAAENDYKAAAAQEASVASALEAAKAETLDLSRRGGQYDTLKRELDASNEVLNSLLSRSKQTDVAQELKSSNIKIVDPAVMPRSPVRPKRLRDIVMGLALGLMLGVGLAFLLDYLDNTLKTPEDVRARLAAPFLGVIPEVKDSSGVVVLTANSPSPFVEGYRLVRTALNYSWPEQCPRVLLVTSTAPGEGKTLTSCNLALTLASMDGRVLIVDCDLRKPQTHVMLKARKTPGLSDVLVGRAKPSEAIQRLPGTNLSLLASGTHVPSPADLMTSRAMRGFLDGLRGPYNWILLDTPPVGAVAEALILSPITDGVVIVAAAETVPRKAVRQTLERIAESGARILGVVLNRAQVEKHSYYYGHYYGHYYGRHYGEEMPPAQPNKVAHIRDKRIAR